MPPIDQTPATQKPKIVDLELKPYRDPTTGQVLYADVVSAIASELVPMSGKAPEAVSTLPTERMAGGWEEVTRQLRERESGRTFSTDLVVRPGGGVDEVSSSSTGSSSTTPVSTLPTERMAAITMTEPSSADAAEIRRLDPTNCENWAPQYRGEFSGWTFELSPPFPAQGRFEFLVFRSPSDGNRLRISPLRPNRDHLYGHAPHMISVRIGGYEVPVICGPGGRSAANFTQARGDAAKWMIYTSHLVAGRRPPFSE